MQIFKSKRFRITFENTIFLLLPDFTIKKFPL